jgi:hypothetical protein
LRDVEAHHPHRDELEKDGRHQGSTWYHCAGSSAVRMFQVPSSRQPHRAEARCACPVLTGLKHWLFTHC